MTKDNIIYLNGSAPAEQQPPKRYCVFITSENKFSIVVEGEAGHYPIKRTMTQELADSFNSKQGHTKVEVLAAGIASIFNT